MTQTLRPDAVIQSRPWTLRPIYCEPLKQSKSSRSQMFFGISRTKNCTIFTGKKPVLGSLFNKVAGLQICNIFKRDSNKGVSCAYPENFRTAFFIENFRWLLLTVLTQYSKVNWGACSLISAFTCFRTWLKTYSKRCTNNFLPSHDKTFSFLLGLIYQVLSISEYVLEKH